MSFLMMYFHWWVMTCSYLMVSVFKVYSLLWFFHWHVCIMIFLWCVWFFLFWWWRVKLCFMTYMILMLICKLWFYDVCNLQESWCFVNDLGGMIFAVKFINFIFSLITFNCLNMMCKGGTLFHDLIFQNSCPFFVFSVPTSGWCPSCLQTGRCPSGGSPSEWIQFRSEAPLE